MQLVIIILQFNLQNDYYRTIDAYVSDSDIPVYSMVHGKQTLIRQATKIYFLIHPLSGTKMGTKTNTALGAIGIWKNVV